MRTTRTTTTIGPGATMISRIQRSLDSDAGRKVRGALAAVLLVGVPLLLRIPILRRHPLVRWLGSLGAVALLAKFATAMRDWEPRTSVRLDVE